jgi:homoserine O-succinyltransferase
VAETYKVFSQVEDREFDALVVTGANVPGDFEKVDYWKELRKILDWASDNSRAKIGLCWAAYAMASHFYGIEKQPISDDGRKLSGIFPQMLTEEGLNSALTRGLDREFVVPVSRYNCLPEDILKDNGLTIVARSDVSGAYIVEDSFRKNIFILNHPEYRNDLDAEFRRDLEDPKLSPNVPENFYVNGDSEQGIVENTWSGPGLKIYQSFIDHLVSPESPSPEYLAHLMEEQQAIVVPIGTSGSGKSELAKRMVRGTSDGASYQDLAGNDHKLEFSQASIDLLIAGKLSPRIVDDINARLEGLVPSGDLDALRKITAASALGITDAQDIGFIGDWMGTPLHDRDWYEYSTTRYLRFEESATGSFTFQLEYGSNLVVDTTGSVFKVKAETRDQLLKSSLLLYIDCHGREAELGRRVAQDKKPIALSSLEHFAGYLKTLKDNEDFWQNAAEYGLEEKHKPFVMRLIDHGDLKSIMRADGIEKPTKEQVDVYTENFKTPIYSILGHYYANHEMKLRHDKYRAMQPHLIIPSNTLFGMNDPAKMVGWMLDKLAGQWAYARPGKNRIPSPLPARPTHFV